MMPQASTACPGPQLQIEAGHRAAAPYFAPGRTYRSSRPNRAVTLYQYLDARLSNGAEILIRDESGQVEKINFF
jgi:hypothetical protein